jgi:hypothetical protein
MAPVFWGPLSIRGMIRSVLRTIARALPFAAAGILAAGCGSSDNASVTSTTAASTAISKAQAIAYAQEVNLVAADIPGATARSQEHESAEARPAGVEFAQCAGGVSPRLRVANIDSAKFRIGKKTEPTQVKSSVEVMPTAALAAHNYRALGSARGRACIAHLVPHILEGASTGRALFGPATTSLLPNLLATGKASFGVRVSTTLIAIVRGKQVRLPIYLDVFDLLAGPAEVSMSASGIAHPPPKATERRLLSLLYTRAETHKL